MFVCEFHLFFLLFCLFFFKQRPAYEMRIIDGSSYVCSSDLLSDTLAPPMAGVRAFMAAYPYNCIEQLLSRAIVLGDQGAWQSLAGELPTFQAPDGLLRYFPSDSLPGSEAPTAYLLSISSEAGLSPERARGGEGKKGLVRVK